VQGWQLPLPYHSGAVARAAIKVSAFPSIGYRPPQKRAVGEQKLCEHVLADRLTAGIACGTANFHRPTNRV